MQENASETSLVEISPINVFLATPEKIVQDEVNLLLQKDHCVWRDEFPDGSRREVRLHWDREPPSPPSVSARIAYYPELPTDLSPEEAEKFSITSVPNTYEYSVGVPLTAPHTSLDGLVTPKISGDGELTKDIAESERPTSVSIEKAVDLIQDGGIFFLTGAGISAQAGIETLDQLETRLGIKRNDPASPFIHEILNYPDKAIRKFVDFNERAFDSPPTPAHSALANIATNFDVKVFSENFDYLHPRSGILAPDLNIPDIKQAGDDEISKIKYVITVGLGADYKGVFKELKRRNPNIRILAIKRTPPEYLGSSDMFLQGDAQKILPEIERRLIE